jgi:hypothetical protein
MIDNLPKLREKQTFPGLNPLARGQFPLKRRDTRHLASRGISAFRSGIHVPGLFCVVRGSITRFSRFRGLGSVYDHGQKEVYSTSFPEPLLQMQAGHPITVVGAKTRFTRVVKLIPKVAAKDSKNKGLSVGG